MSSITTTITTTSVLVARVVRKEQIQPGRETHSGTGVQETLNKNVEGKKKCDLMVPLHGLPNIQKIYMISGHASVYGRTLAH